MPTLALTDTLIRSAKAGKERLQITDARCQGLELRVTSTGAKSFAFQYRSKRDSKVVRLTLGSYPDLVVRQGAIDGRRSSPIDCRGRRPARREASRSDHGEGAGKDV